MSTKMNGGMKMISADGTRVLERNDPEMHALLLEALKNATEVNVVSTGSRYSLIVRVSLPVSLFRDDLIGEDGQLMREDERWLPTTGKPIRELILKFILVSSPMTQYTYDAVNDKCTMLAPDVIHEYEQQRDAFDATKHRVPLCPDVVELIPFPNREAFDEIFTNTKNEKYKKCRVFSKLRTYFSMPFKPQVVMIVMESIPATYVPLKTLIKSPDEISLEITQQVCAMYAVLFHVCFMIALDAHRSNWLVDMKKPTPLRVKLIDYGMCLNTLYTDKIREIVETYFDRHPTELPAYLKLMGANPGDSHAEVMVIAIQSVRVPHAPMESWIHKILVISMLIDGFFNMNHSTTKTTCQMKTVFNLVYDNACETMSKILDTLSLDLPTYLEAHPENAARTNEMLTNMEAYMTTYYGLRSRTWSSSNAPDNEVASDASAMGVFNRYGGKKTTRKPITSIKSRKTRKTRKTRTSIKSNKPVMHRRRIKKLH